MVSLKGHFWTLMPPLGRAWRRPAAPPGEAWQASLIDPIVGPVQLTGRFHAPDQARDAVVLVHGLGGCCESPGMRSAAAAAESAELASLRLNLRGADLRGVDYYHAGLVADLEAALASPELARFEHVFLLGFSLGGHVALRLACQSPPPRLAAVAAVCSPLDLHLTQEAIDHGVEAALYRVYLLHYLKQIYAGVAARRAVPTPVERVRTIRTLREWDDLVVTPRFGFADALDYYERMSVGPVLSRLAVPALLIAAMHDPMVPAATLVPWLKQTPARLTVRWVEDGGHMGFPPRIDLGLGLPGGGTSLESQVLTWLRRA
ncbi:MAG: alpha/beta fold hydrolase [Acidobacteriota bacterium]